MSRRSELYDFRMIGLEKQVCKELMQKNWCIEPEYTKIEDSERYVFTFRITKLIPVTELKQILENNIHTIESYGIFVSFTTTYAMDGLEFPKEVTELHKALGGDIDVSCIFNKE